MVSKELKEIKKEYNGLKEDFAETLQNLAITLIEACLNKHKSKEVTIMFQKALVVANPFRYSQPYTNAVGMMVVSGVKLTKEVLVESDVTWEDDVRYSIELLDAENQTAMYFDFATISTRMQIIDELIKTARCE